MNYMSVLDVSAGKWTRKQSFIPNVLIEFNMVVLGDRFWAVANFGTTGGSKETLVRARSANLSLSLSLSLCCKKVAC